MITIKLMDSILHNIYILGMVGRDLGRTTIYKLWGAVGENDKN